MGKNEQASPRSRDPRHDTIGYGLGSVVLAVLGVVFLLEADAWYLVLGGCIVLMAAAVGAARAIISLRAVEYAAPE